MIVRTTKASTSALANGEVTEDDLSNAEKALRRVGIEVRSDIETFKSFDEIMGELYEKVDSLSDMEAYDALTVSVKKMKFISTTQTMDFINNYVSNKNKYVSFIVDKRYLPEYNSKNAFSDEELGVKEELSTISKEDKAVVIMYLLEVMRKHDIITEDEYHTVLYKYS